MGLWHLKHLVRRSLLCRFFPIFFAKEVSLTPVAVNVLMAAQPLVIGLCAAAGQWLAKFIGGSNFLTIPAHVSTFITDMASSVAPDSLVCMTFA